MLVFNNKGQSLLEITIVMGIAISIIVAITIITIQGLQSNQFAQNQLQATKLAQEGLELVRSMKNNNIPIRVNSQLRYWYGYSNPTNGVWQPSTFGFDPNDPTNCSNCFYKFNPPGCISCELRQTTHTDVGERLGNFFRRVIIEDCKNAAQGCEANNPDEKKVTVEVYWSDASTGTNRVDMHKAHVSTILANYCEGGGC